MKNDGNCYQKAFTLLNHPEFLFVVGSNENNDIFFPKLKHYKHFISKSGFEYPQDQELYTPENKELRLIDEGVEKVEFKTKKLVVIQFK